MIARWIGGLLVGSHHRMPVGLPVSLFIRKLAGKFSRLFLQTLTTLSTTRRITLLITISFFGLLSRTLDRLVARTIFLLLEGLFAVIIVGLLVESLD